MSRLVIKEIGESVDIFVECSSDSLLGFLGNKGKIPQGTKENKPVLGNVGTTKC